MPIQYQDFMRTAAARQRYWARSTAGWPLLRDAEPNAVHRQITHLENSHRTVVVVTQNVDGLHQQAGQREVIELHGSVYKVVCTDCAAVYSRDDFQTRLSTQNPTRNFRIQAVAPDGDADLEDAELSDFTVPNCPRCDGILKPDVVFFGENVPKPRVELVYDKLKRSDRLLVLGSSLMVYSGYRFVRRAKEWGIPVAIVNRGRTRADAEADIKVDGECREVLQALI